MLCTKLFSFMYSLNCILELRVKTKYVKARSQSEIRKSSMWHFNVIYNTTNVIKTHNYNNGVK